MSLWSVLQGAAAQVLPGGGTYSSYNPPKRKVVQPTQPQVSAPAAQVSQPQNNIPTTDQALDFGKLQFSNKVAVPTQNTSQPSDAEIAARSTGAVGTNVAGGLIGAVKGLVQLPSMVLNATNLAGLGAAKLTGNEEAAANASQRIQNNKYSNAYDSFVRPITQPLTTAELATDQTARTLAPWQTDAQKNAGKVFANLIPVDAAASAAIGASKAAKLARTAEVLPEVSNTVRIPVRQVTDIPVRQETTIPVKSADVGAVTVPVRSRNVPGNLIQDVSGGEKLATPNAMIKQNAVEQQAKEIADRFDSQSGPSKPIQDVTPQTASNPAVVTSNAVQDERKALDQALANKEITKAQHKAANDALDNTPTVDGQPVGSPVPFRLSAADVATNEQKIIKEYADTLKSLGEGNGVNITADGARVSNNVRSAANKGKRMTKADWIAEAESQLRSGKAESSVQKAFSDVSNPEVQSLLSKDAPSVVPGKRIEVKQVDPIDVSTPKPMPETPSTVRPTTTTAPVAEKSATVAAQTPPSLPKLGTVLPDGTKVTKRTIEAARRNNKNIKKLAKIQADTQSVIDNAPKLSPKPEGDRGFVPTGEFTKGTHGNVTETAHQSTEAAQGAHDAANLSTSDVLSQAEKELMDNQAVTEKTVRDLKAKIGDPNVAKNTPEGKALLTAYDDAISRYARGLALTDRVVRRDATGDQIANRFVNKMILISQDASKLTDSHIQSVKNAENAFTNARDAAKSAADRFKATGSTEDFNAWKQAHDAEVAADRASRTAEYNVTKEVLKGDNRGEALKAIQKAEEDTGAYSMDQIDANMLSGTGTMVRNYVNTLLPRAENKLFGKAASFAVKGKGVIGGSNREGAKLGTEIGKTNFKADMAARKEAGVGRIRRWVTAGNTVGEKNIQATAYAQGFDHYKQLLAKEGYTGEELINRAKFNTLTDPDGLIKNYEAQTLQANALSSLTHSKKIENWLADTLQKKIADGGFGQKSQQAGRFGAKAVTRVGIGFPTVIARSLLEGTKRATLGIPEALWSVAKYTKGGDKQLLANELATAIKHAGSGGSLMVVGALLGNSGIMTGAYPTDPAERDLWKSQGKEANSIKIGGQWFGIPGYLGGFALPLQVGASLAAGNVKDTTSLQNIYRNALDASPVDSIQSTLDIMTGKASDSKIKNATTSLVRAMTPAGAFLAELAKLTDHVKNDTTTKDSITNIIDAIAAGIPGVNNMVNKIPATDSNGNILYNPNPIGTALGAQGSEQSQGTQDSQQAQADTNATYDTLKQNGVLDNPNLMQLVDKKLQAQIKRGQDLTPDQVTSIQKAVSKGITTGITADSDSNWRENGDYATDRAATQVKLALMEADPTAKKSEIANLNTQIARDNVLEKNQVPYEFLQTYQSTSQSEWAKMGDPESKTYDPDMYNKLAELDKLLTDAGGSYNTDPKKNKYTPKDSSSGKSAKKINTSFGALSTSGNPMAPKAKAYQTANFGATSNLPVISSIQPNIVHKITRGTV